MSLRVMCRSSDLGSVPDSFLDEGRGYRRSTTLPLTVGRIYVVFAITNSIGGFWYYILDDDDGGVPVWYPSAVFDVLEGEIPEGWVLGHGGASRYGMSVVIGPREWARDPTFYERLYGGDDAAIAVFRQLRSDAGE